MREIFGSCRMHNFGSQGGVGCCLGSDFAGLLTNTKTCKTSLSEIEKKKGMFKFHKQWYFFQRLSNTLEKQSYFLCQAEEPFNINNQKHK